MRVEAVGVVGMVIFMVGRRGIRMVVGVCRVVGSRRIPGDERRMWVEVGSFFIFFLGVDLGIFGCGSCVWAGRRVEFSLLDVGRMDGWRMTRRQKVILVAPLSLQKRYHR